MAACGRVTQRRHKKSTNDYRLIWEGTTAITKGQVVAISRHAVTAEALGVGGRRGAWIHGAGGRGQSPVEMVRKISEGVAVIVGH